MLLLLLQRIVIGPLTAIREHSDQVAEEGFGTEPLVLQTNDEIGELACAFDHMIGRLGDAHAKLAEASRAAGRSQVAGNVIHNVGNVLTNVNSLLDVVTERVEGLRVRPLHVLADKLRQQHRDEALMSATPNYLEGLATSLDHDQNTISELMSTLHDNIRHIHDVIRDQQRHTGGSAKPKAVRLAEVVDEAIGCSRAKLDQDDVRVSASDCSGIVVMADHSLLLQSLINVIGNARHALRETHGGPRRITIKTTVRDESARIQIVDNGIGMSKQTLSRVFDAHFTTKQSGTGLGLHFCAITLKRWGGTIQAHSEGLGRGTTMTIQLPLATTGPPTVPRLTPNAFTVSGANDTGVVT